MLFIAPLSPFNRNFNEEIRTALTINYISWPSEYVKINYIPNYFILTMYRFVTNPSWYIYCTSWNTEINYYIKVNCKIYKENISLHYRHSSRIKMSVKKRFQGAAWPKGWKFLKKKKKMKVFIVTVTWIPHWIDHFKIVLWNNYTMVFAYWGTN